jgi:hypothetical protein
MFGPINDYITGDPKNTGDSKNTGEQELEIRFKNVDVDLFCSLFTKLSADATSSVVSKSITATTEAGKRKEIYFGKTKVEKYIEKKQGKYWFAEQKSYKLASSIEIPIPPFQTSDAKIIRFRLRNSLVLSTLPDWRFDFTVIKEIGPNEMQNIEKYRKIVLVGDRVVDSNNFVAVVGEIVGLLVGVIGALEVEYI